MNVFLDWNLVLDERGGPNHVNNFCDAPFLFDTSSKNLNYRELQSYIWHFSHFIDHNSVRIGVSRYTSMVEVAAFETASGLVVVFLNSYSEDIPAYLRINNRCAPITIPAKSIASGMIVI